MRRILTAGVVATTLLPAGIAAVAAPVDDPGRARAPVASVRLVECVRVPENRTAVFRGAMRRIPGAGRMWMRFKLQERVGAGPFRSVKAPGLGVWRKSVPGVRRFAHRQRVLALAEGSAYRTVVSFRWYDSDGELIRRTKRRSPACRQPGLLPNLRVVRIAGGAPEVGVPGAYRYAVTVANRGQVAAQAIGVSLAVDGDTVDTHTVGSLAPGESRRLFFSGPACTETVTAVADPGDTVREVTEEDNTLASACPAGG